MSEQKLGWQFHPDGSATVTTPSVSERIVLTAWEERDGKVGIRKITTSSDGTLLADEFLPGPWIA
jgi:hypothetical protein